MSTDNPDPPARGRCRAKPETVHAICPNGGAQPETAPVAAEPVPETPLTAPMTAIAASRWKVLALLFLVLGPLALPVLWKSPRFSRAGKSVLTILVAIQTVAVIWLLWYFVSWFLDEFQRLYVVSEEVAADVLILGRLRRPRFRCAVQGCRLPKLRREHRRSATIRAEFPEIPPY